MPPTSFLASPGLMWLRKKTSKTKENDQTWSLLKLMASKSLEHKALKMKTNFEEKFWTSIFSVSRVSAGKMQINWRVTKKTVNHSVFARCM